MRKIPLVTKNFAPKNTGKVLTVPMANQIFIFCLNTKELLVAIELKIQTPFEGFEDLNEFRPFHIWLKILCNFIFAD